MNYLEMCNEVLVRMREMEISSVTDQDNDPQQKLVCKFVNDAKQFVERSHSWNALRKIWVIDLAHEVHKYNLMGASEQARIYLVRYVSGAVLKEANPQWMERKPGQIGSPHWYTLSDVHNHNVTLKVWPYPDNTFGDSHDVYEFGEAEFPPSSSFVPDESEAAEADLYAKAKYMEGRYSNYGVVDDGVGDEPYFGSPDKTLLAYGFAHQGRLKNDTDVFLVPEDPILYYALAYAARERGEAGGASSAELFALAKQYLSDAISWDANNSHLEYIWNVG
jgi:hypothetical protein